MANIEAETSPVDRGYYEGLQVDTRAKDDTEKHLDTSAKRTQRLSDSSTIDDEKAYLSGKQTADAVRYEESPVSATSTMNADPDTSKPKMVDSVFAVESPPQPRVQKICGMRRQSFWIAFIVVLAVVVAAAIIGGTVGGMKPYHDSPSSHTQVLPANPASTANGTLQLSDVIVASPLNILSFDNNSTGGPESRQSFRVYYQSVYGDIKESVSDGLSTWHSASAQFTDAMNNTGLATVTYLNGTSQQASMFYVGTNGLLQEKRKSLTNKTDIWQPGSLNKKNLAMVGNLTVPNQDENEVHNDWDSYRMAAVYSTDFHSGPGIRLYYHATELNKTSWIQELIWNQQSDKWTNGASFYDAWPTSHIAVTLDETSKTLHLFFSNGNRTLKEYTANVSATDTSYVPGLELSNYLSRDNADFSAIAYSSTTYLYHYSTVDPAGIYEQRISNDLSNITDPANYNSAANLVASPSLVSTSGASSYQPLAASLTSGTGLQPQMYVFWADAMTGNDTGPGGYGSLNEISRGLVGNSSWPAVGTGQVALPLGHDDQPPWFPSL